MKDNKHIPSSFEIKLYGELTPYELNPSMSKCRVATFRKYGNNNGSYFTDEISEIMVQNAPGSPIVGKFDAEKEDFTSHLTIKDTKAYGFIPPENPNFAWEKRMENDGTEYEYACFDVVLWTDRYKEAKLIPFKSESMELNPSSITGDWKNIDGETYFVYDSANIYGLCVLGDAVAPCFDAACFYEKDSIQTYMDALREEIKNNFSLMTQSKEKIENQGGKEEMDYKINLPQIDNFQLLFEALNPDVDENSNRNFANAIYDIQNEFALYHSYSDGKNYQVNYSINDGAVALEEAKEVALFMNIVDENEVNAYNDIMGEEHSFASIQSHIADLNNTISEQQTTIDNFNANDYPAKIAELEQRISAYEAAENKAISEQKDALIESYSEDVDGEVLDDVKTNKDNYSLADIENKLAVNFARKQRANNGGKVPHVNEDEDPVLAVLNKYKAMKGE